MYFVLFTSNQINVTLSTVKVYSVVANFNIIPEYLQYMQFHLATMDSKAAKSAKKKERKNQKNEEMRYYKELLDKLATDDTREQIAFPPTLDKGQRKKLHTYAHSHGLKSKSSGTGKI